MVIPFLETYIENILYLKNKNKNLALHKCFVNLARKKKVINFLSETKARKISIQKSIIKKLFQTNRK